MKIITHNLAHTVAKMLVSAGIPASTVNVTDGNCIVIADEDHIFSRYVYCDEDCGEVFREILDAWLFT